MRKKINEKKKPDPLQKECWTQQQVIDRTSKEIYENITQCLCLARLQLGNVDLTNKEETLAIIGETNLLIGKTVADLRNLAKELSALHPETKMNY